MRRPLVAGAAVVGAYVLVATITMSLSSRGIRPLFEGIGPNAPYQWVDPPKAFEAGNVKPHANDSQVPMGPAGNQLAGAGSTDGQIVLNLPEGAIPARPPDDRVTIHIEPHDPDDLADTPPGTRPNGNAYEVEPVYRPSGAPVPALNTPGNVILTVPEPAQGLLFSADGKSWQQLQSQEVGGTGTVGGPFTAGGYYLATASPFTERDDGGSSSSWIGVLVVGALTVGLVVLFVFGPGISKRIKRRRTKARPKVVQAAKAQQRSAAARKRKKARKGRKR